MEEAVDMETLTGLTEEGLKSLYPYLEDKCYALPPSHFNQWKLKAGDSRSSRCEHYFEQDTPNESKQRGDEGQQRVLAALQNFGQSGPAADLLPMFIFSSVNFETVLTGDASALPVRRRRTKTSRFAGSAKTKPEDRDKGETDILIVSKRYGLIIIEIKSVGDLKRDDPESRLCDIKTALDKFLKKLPGKKKWGNKVTLQLKLNVAVTVVLALPNVSRGDLTEVSGTYPQLEQELAVGMSASADLTAVQARCLCEDELPPRHKSPDPEEHRLPNLRIWWTDFIRSLKQTQSMTDSQYKICIAAFVGPKTRVTIWSPKDKRITSLRRHVRTQGETVHETGSRFVMYVLRQKQVEVLNSRSKRVYLSGPPGSGKTMLMILKAVQWVLEENRYVVIVSSDVSDNVMQPVAMETNEKIKETLKRQKNRQTHTTSPGLRIPTPNRSSVWVFSSYGTHDPKDVIREIREHVQRQSIAENAVSFLLDEIIDDKSRTVVKLMKETFRDSYIWCAGPWPRDKPKDFTMMTLPECLRCPPSIQVLLRHTEGDCGEQRKPYRYTENLLPLPCDGSPIKWLPHTGEGHEGAVENCIACGRNLGRYLLKELHVCSATLTQRPGKTASNPLHESLTFSDVLIVTARLSLNKTPFLKQLRGKGLSIRVVEPASGKQDLVAFPKDHAVATDISLVAGLERMVVVFVPDQVSFDNQPKKHKGKRLQQKEFSGRLAALGADNREALWYILSRCLSQAVVIHFGDCNENNDDASTDSDNDDDSNDGDGGRSALNMHVTPNTTNTNRSFNAYYVCVLLVLLALIFLVLYYHNVDERATNRNVRENTKHKRPSKRQDL